MNDSSWHWAAELLGRFMAQPARLQHLMESLPNPIDGGRRRQCQNLLYGAVKHLGLLDATLMQFMKHRPKPALMARLVLAASEMKAEPEKMPKIVDHAVGQVKRSCSQSEARLANAVLRKVGDALANLAAPEEGDASGLSHYYSHPVWLVERWVAQYGFAATEQFLAWNQQEPTNYLRCLVPDAEAELRSLGFALSESKKYYSVPSGKWGEAVPLIEQGLCYAQNPASGVAVNLLADAFAGGRILDLCAAPGGKSIALAASLGERCSGIVAVDLAGPRFARMEQNFARYDALPLEALASNVLALDPEKQGDFEAVFLDVPCSNSGVIQRKSDVKWRLKAEELPALIELQGKLLLQAARFVGPSGCLIYSTCSVDTEENQDVVDAFLASSQGKAFQLEHSVITLPWQSNCDGAGAFLLRRV